VLPHIGEREALQHTTCYRRRHCQIQLKPPGWRLAHVLPRSLPRPSSAEGDRLKTATLLSLIHRKIVPGGLEDTDACEDSPGALLLLLFRLT